MSATPIIATHDLTTVCSGHPNPLPPDQPRAGHHRGGAAGRRARWSQPGEVAEEPAGAVGEAVVVLSLRVIPGGPGSGVKFHHNSQANYTSTRLQSKSSTCNVLTR